jgi:hypothetical protein
MLFTFPISKMSMKLGVGISLFILLGPSNVKLNFCIFSGGAHNSHLNFPCSYSLEIDWLNVINPGLTIH